MSLDPVAAAKEAAARHAVYHHIRSGMRVGLGSGTTALYAVKALAERIANEGLSCNVVVSTSKETADLAASVGIEIYPEIEPSILPLDVTIDGADEADPQLNLIKGGGGASLREKLVAVATTREIIVAHESKRVAQLGLTFPLPVVIVPYAWRATAQLIEQTVGRTGILRARDGKTFVTDDSLYVFDVTPGPIEDPVGLERELKRLPGVVDVGLFVGIAKLFVIGHADGTVEEFEPAP